MEGSRNFSGNTVGDNAKVILGNAHVTVNTTALDDDKLFLQEFSQINPVYDKKDILMRKGPLLRDPCRWILDHEDYKIWYYAKKAGVFWIKGDPGKGKTMLLCGIIEELEKVEELEKAEELTKIDNHLSSPNFAYFFVQAADYRANTAAAVIRGLIFTMLKPRPALLKHIREKYEDGPKGQLNGDKALAILCDMFETIVQDLIDFDDEHFICVVDALDECIEDCEHLLNLVFKTSDTVKWLVSSRNEKHIERKLSKLARKVELEVEQNAKQISTSIDIYIDHHVREITAIQDDEALQSRTSNILKTKASGTFLWVALVIEQLRDTDHWQVEDVLKEMPEGLQSIYGLMLSRIDTLKTKVGEACRALLFIVSTAMRPLFIMELLSFINAYWKDDERYKTPYQLRDVRDMIKGCASFLSIRDDIVYFVHQSAKDYLLEGVAHQFVRYRHYTMFELSLDIMSNNLKYNIYDLTNPQIYVDDIPLMNPDSDALASSRYCCTFWVEHLVQGIVYLEDCQKLHSFLIDKFLCWIESLALMRSYILHALPAIQKLFKTMHIYYLSEAKLHTSSISKQFRYLVDFFEDACRFLAHSTTWVPHWPLQLYFLAIEFEPGHSLIKKIFNQTVRDRFGPLPAAFQMSQNPESSSERRAVSFSSQQGDLILHHYLTFSPSWCPPHLKKTRPILTYWKMEETSSKHGEEVEVRASKVAIPEKGHSRYVPREDVMISRGFHSHFNQESLDLKQGPYQGHDLGTY